MRMSFARLLKDCRIAQLDYTLPELKHLHSSSPLPMNSAQCEGEDCNCIQIKQQSYKNPLYDRSST